MFALNLTFEINLKVTQIETKINLGLFEQHVDEFRFCLSILSSIQISWVSKHIMSIGQSPGTLVEHQTMPHARMILTGRHNELQPG